jgi:hypothetical protein
MLWSLTCSSYQGYIGVLVDLVHLAELQALFFGIILIDAIPESIMSIPGRQYQLLNIAYLSTQRNRIPSLFTTSMASSMTLGIFL